MTPDTSELSLIAAEIRRSKTFFIAGHVKPDGDTIGSALALASVLKRLGKKPRVYSREQVPDYLLFLPGARSIPVREKVRGKFDCAVILECSGLERMGDLITAGQAKSVVNIDHHAHFRRFGDINYIRPDASSTAEMLFGLFSAMKIKLTRHEAECLYTGLVTDTGKFQQANTTPAALRVSAELLETGVAPERIYECIYAQGTLSAKLLLGAALETLRCEPGGKVSTMDISLDMYRRTGSSAIETEGIINHTMMVTGVQIGILFREENSGGQVKVSFRSRNKHDVNLVARHFGGGGHRGAAGCTLKGTLPEARKRVLDYIKRSIKL